MKKMLLALTLILWGTAASAEQAREVSRRIVKYLDQVGIERIDDGKTARTGIDGYILVSKGTDVVFDGSRGSSLTKVDYEREGDRFLAWGPGFGGFTYRDSWRWASVTKQVIAVLVMQEVAAGHVDLDAPITHYLPNFAGNKGSKITVRQLLRHQSGLPDPDDTPKTKTGVPSYYTSGWQASRDPSTGYCAGTSRAEPGGNWRYNNCDYIVAGALLQSVTGKPWAQLVDERIAKPLKLRSLKAFPTKNLTVQGYIGGVREPAIDFASFGAAAGLYGTVQDLWKFDRALMTGKLLPDAQRAEMWDGQPDLGFIALGQWAFGAGLKGCATPVRIIERRGAIGGVQVRNFILPDADVVVIAFTNRDDFDFGEIWQGKGFAFDLLSAAACAS